MGTNYYWYEKPKCDKCGRCDERVHIGKSSWGWCFSLKVYPWDGLNSLSAWIEKFKTPGSYIEDEYGELIGYEEMIREIKREGAGWDDWIKKNEKLRRHTNVWGLEGRCVEGEGNYDLCNYDFS